MEIARSNVPSSIPGMLVKCAAEQIWKSAFGVPGPDLLEKSHADHQILLYHVYCRRQNYKNCSILNSSSCGYH
jgi:hypothetical protein